MHTLIRFILIAICGLLVLVSGAAQAEIAFDAEDQLLSVSFDQVPIEQALSQLQARTGVDFILSNPIEYQLTDQFAALTLADAVRRLLGDFNFIALNVPNSRRLERVVISGLIDRSPRPPPPIAVAPTRPVSELILARTGGHFFVNGAIGRTAAVFLVDTGATLVALSDELARQAGLRFGRQQTVNTASGPSRGYLTRIDRLSVGEFKLQGVRAMILPAMKREDHVLLGMNVLRQFDIDQRGDTLKIRER